MSRLEDELRRQLEANRAFDASVREAVASQGREVSLPELMRATASIQQIAPALIPPNYKRLR